MCRAQQSPGCIVRAGLGGEILTAEGRMEDGQPESTEIE